MITSLRNQIIAEGVISVEWELMASFCKILLGKMKFFRERKLQGTKLTKQILNLEKIIGKLIRQQVDIDRVQFEFFPGCGTKISIFILRKLQEKYLAKKNLCFAFVFLEKAFD